MSKKDDMEYDDYTLDKVTQCEGGWEIGHGGLSFFCEDVGVIPHIGSKARYYGCGFGYPVRGLDIDDKEIFYRTPDEQIVLQKQWVLDGDNKKREKYKTIGKAHLDADYASLPLEFQKRIDYFRNSNSDFRWKMEPYEMFACVEAVLIAKTLGSAEAILKFKRSSWLVQIELVPKLSNEHSGNTFDFACGLAQLYLTFPELLYQFHGALCALVGCVEYGCFVAKEKKMT